MTILIRRESLSVSMSDYLVQEIAATANIVLQPYAEVVDGAGDGRLERIVVRDTRGGSTTTLPADALFVMIGAEPRTDWLDPTVARDDRGYLLTGDDVPPDAWPITRRPAFLETSVPGVFAVGDVQHGSTKRVATAVGSGDGRTPGARVHPDRPGPRTGDYPYPLSSVAGARSTYKLRVPEQVGP